MTNDLDPPSLCNGRRKLSIFDFDMTLFRSPDRATGEIAYFEATGQEWPFAGWYGRKETLYPPIIPEIPGPDWWIQEIVNQHGIARGDDDSWTVLMTGRPIKLRSRIRELLATQALFFDEEYYRGMKGMSKSQDTFDIKADIIKTRLIHNELELVTIYEDRPEHIGRFTALAGELKSIVGKSLEQVVIWDAGTMQRYEL